MPVELVIKAPNQKIPDHTVNCELQWDVLKLKKHLTEVYPTNPKPEEQRLIYAGRLIKDHLSLKDFIKYEDGQRYILHLVCSQHSVSSPVHKNTTAESVPNVNNPSSHPSSHLRQRTLSPTHNDSHSSSNGATVNPHSQPETNVGNPAMGAVGPELVAQQMAAMQYVYAQYMAQFIQQAQLAGFPAAYPDFSSVVLNPATTAATPPIGVPADNVAPANVNRAQAAGNQNVRMNAQGGPLLDDEEDDMENRDWLDWFYIFSRAMVLFTILFFYSSLGRFMVVTGVAILIYMYQGGWFGARVLQAAPVQQPQQHQPQQAEERQNVVNDQWGNEDIQEPENQDPVSSPETQGQPGNEDEEEIRNVMNLMDGTREPNHRSEPNLVQTFWLFLTSFFVSLIPEQPPPVNVN